MSADISTVSGSEGPILTVKSEKILVKRLLHSLVKLVVKDPTSDIRLGGIFSNILLLFTKKIPGRRSVTTASKIETERRQAVISRK